MQFGLAILDYFLREILLAYSEVEISFIIFFLHYENLFNIPQIITNTCIAYYLILLAQAIVDHIPFSHAVSLSIVGLSGASPQDVPGLLFTECQPEEHLTLTL